MNLPIPTKSIRSTCSLWIILFLPFFHQRTSDAFIPLPIKPNTSSGYYLPRSRFKLEAHAWDALSKATVLNPATGKQCNALDGVIRKSPNDISESITAMIDTSGKSRTKEHILVAVLPQLGDFDSAEYAELLASVQEDLRRAKITLRVIGIGDTRSAKRFAAFSGLDLESIRIDPTGEIHRSLGLHEGPNWDVPTFVPEAFLNWFSSYVGVEDDQTRDSRAIFRSWLNYMAMCAGIKSPDTLPEIFRGYIGDKNSPERIQPDEIVTVPASGGTTLSQNGGDGKDPFIVITGTTDVKLGPLNYKQAWKEESGYQRPLELATVRLRIMVEVLSNFREYVPDQRHLALRGATYLFRREEQKASEKNDLVSLVYEHIDTGILSYSKTMGRPLSFLESFIGKKALNPLGLGDISLVIE